MLARMQIGLPRGQKLAKVMPSSGQLCNIRKFGKGCGPLTCLQKMIGEQLGAGRKWIEAG